MSILLKNLGTLLTTAIIGSATTIGYSSTNFDNSYNHSFNNITSTSGNININITMNNPVRSNEDKISDNNRRLNELYDRIPASARSLDTSSERISEILEKSQEPNQKDFVKHRLYYFIKKYINDEPNMKDEDFNLVKEYYEKYQKEYYKKIYQKKYYKKIYQKKYYKKIYHKNKKLTERNIKELLRRAKNALSKEKYGELKESSNKVIDYLNFNNRFDNLQNGRFYKVSMGDNITVEKMIGNIYNGTTINGHEHLKEFINNNKKTLRNNVTNMLKDYNRSWNNIEYYNFNSVNDYKDKYKSIKQDIDNNLQNLEYKNVGIEHMLSKHVFSDNEEISGIQNNEKYNDIKKIYDNEIVSPKMNTVTHYYLLKPLMENLLESSNNDLGITSSIHGKDSIRLVVSNVKEKEFQNDNNVYNNKIVLDLIKQNNNSIACNIITFHKLDPEQIQNFKAKTNDENNRRTIRYNDL